MGEELRFSLLRHPGAIIIALAVVVAIGWWAVRGVQSSRADHDHDHPTSQALPGSTRAVLRLGLSDSPLLAAVYRAEEAAGDPPRWELVRAGSSSEVGYALLAGTVDAGLLAVDRAAALVEHHGQGGELEIIGVITFPYGASVVLRKGAGSRLEDLAGKRIAVSSPRCGLFAQFSADAHKRGLDPAGFTIVSMPFDAMAAALESGAVDAAVVRGADSLVAVRAGHQVVYQNWQMQAGDDCCPPIIAQSVFLLVARARHPALYALVAALAVANEAKPAELRRAASAATGFPADLLSGFPAPGFTIPDTLALAAYTEHGQHHR